MLARAYRLRLGRDIERVYKHGQSVGTSYLRAKKLANNLGSSRLAIVVSTKVSKKSTVRNRARRRVSGEVERLWQTIVPGYDIVINVYSDLSDLAGPELSTQVASTLQKLGVTK